MKVSEEQAVAREIADVLMRQALVGGPLERVMRLTKLLRILRIVVRIVTAERDLAAYSANAIWPHRRLSKLASVTPSTMQRWTEAGRKVAEPQQVQNSTTVLNSVENCNSNSEPLAA